MGTHGKAKRSELVDSLWATESRGFLDLRAPFPARSSEVPCPPPTTHTPEILLSFPLGGLGSWFGDLLGQFPNHCSASSDLRDCQRILGPVPDLSPLFWLGRSPTKIDRNKLVPTYSNLSTGGGPRRRSSMSMGPYPRSPRGIDFI